jgi:hypothetical protein
MYQKTYVVQITDDKDADNWAVEIVCDGKTVLADILEDDEAVENCLGGFFWSVVSNWTS